MIDQGQDGPLYWIVLLLGEWGGAWAVRGFVTAFILWLVWLCATEESRAARRAQKDREWRDGQQAREEKLSGLKKLRPDNDTDLPTSNDPAKAKLDNLRRDIEASLRQR